MSNRLVQLGVIFLLIVSVARADDLPKDTGYRGIWYQIAANGKPKYSGGFATYPQQIRPFAIYRKEVNKTFFVYGGRPADKHALHMVSYYDHDGNGPAPDDSAG